MTFSHLHIRAHTSTRCAVQHSIGGRARACGLPSYVCAQHMPKQARACMHGKGERKEAATEEGWAGRGIMSCTHTAGVSSFHFARGFCGLERQNWSGCGGGLSVHPTTFAGAQAAWWRTCVISKLQRANVLHLQSRHFLHSIGNLPLCAKFDG